ncbi:mitochondrial fission 1 protein isoform X2 [Eurytemora carolleeae]|uniref:mitochondrial fission 1 protein isoform X1 n=1 Tax=Eurytemora carolleeae TaxID=1294199 RepID=UPI000C76ADF6|nr:mitochondrial fission 1 protein isoform X1 [Eurytemora carolleeae]XP_023326909.1 mitochondrial fission 1 protein isoform X2 [Eurytemora carolleeae]|eukprot:XP_023326908.1 mitochondrial fission 1 protein-like isoform X1 [Eurytemora affinis]
MEHMLNDTVPVEDLKKFEQKYHEELQQTGKASANSQFEYAWCLVRSRYQADIRKGILLLEELFQDHDGENKRDYLYYLAIGNTKLKEYSVALKYVRALLQFEPGNRQAQELEAIVTKSFCISGVGSYCY